VRAGLDLGLARAAYVRLSRRGTEIALERAALGDLDPRADDAARAAALASALGSEARRSRVMLGVPGRDAILRYLHIPFVPAWRLRLLMEVEVRDVEEKAGEPLSSDYRQLTVPDDVAGWDGATILVGLAKEAALLGRYRALEAAGVRARAALPSAVALFDAYVGLGHYEEGKTVVLLDAGPEGSELAILRDGLLVFARGLPASREGAGDLTSREAMQLASAVASSIPFCRAQQKLRALPVDRVLVSGAFARSEDLLRSLRSALKVEVAVFDPLERLDAEPLPDADRAALEGRGPELAIAIGLALAQDHPRAVDLDLTPRPIVARREFLSRTLFLYAAGALLALALVVGFATAALAKARTQARRDGLRKIQVELEERRRDVEDRVQRNTVARQVIDTLARRTQPGGAALRLISRLREATPARVTVSEVLMEAPPAPRVSASGLSDPLPAPAEVAFKVKGVVDNATGDAVTVLGRFEAALREDPGIASAKVTGTPVAQPGALLEFTLSVQVRAEARGAED
jgi:Tfp pilus assembly PilM family ATPase